MLTIVVPATEQYDEIHEEFINTKEQQLRLEHSLVSISKWEAKWNKPFLSKENKSREETIDYIKCMNTTQNVDPNVFRCVTNENIRQIMEYIEAPMTATWFSDENNKKYSREIITSEVIYYWMIALQIPFECQRWHLNRLLTLIKVCNEKNKPNKKMSKRDLMNRNKALNAARLQKYNTSG